MSLSVKSDRKKARRSMHGLGSLFKGLRDDNVTSLAEAAETSSLADTSDNSSAKRKSQRSRSKKGKKGSRTEKNPSPAPPEASTPASTEPSPRPVQPAAPAAPTPVSAPKTEGVVDVPTEATTVVPKGSVAARLAAFQQPAAESTPALSVPKLQANVLAASSPAEKSPREIPETVAGGAAARRALFEARINQESEEVAKQKEKRVQPDRAVSLYNSMMPPAVVEEPKLTKSPSEKISTDSILDLEKEKERLKEKEAKDKEAKDRETKEKEDAKEKADKALEKEKSGAWSFFSSSKKQADPKSRRNRRPTSYSSAELLTESLTKSEESEQPGSDGSQHNLAASRLSSNLAESPVVMSPSSTASKSKGKSTGMKFTFGKKRAKGGFEIARATEISGPTISGPTSSANIHNTQREDSYDPKLYSEEREKAVRAIAEAQLKGTVQKSIQLRLEREKQRQQLVDSMASRAKPSASIVAGGVKSDLYLVEQPAKATKQQASAPLYGLDDSQPVYGIQEYGVASAAITQIGMYASEGLDPYSLAASSSSSSSSGSDSDSDSSSSSSSTDDDWVVDPSTWTYQTTGLSSKQVELPSFPGYNWNTRFQSLVDRLRTSEDQLSEFAEDVTADIAKVATLNSELVELSQDFIEAAKRWGTIIIAEVYLPMEQRTIRPIKIGGVAGGDKYIVHDILFKFAIDSNGLYEGSNYAASKVADAELKGMLSYLNLNMTDLCVPLMALVDYRGFRLIAMSLLPIGGEGSLIYGTNDAGKTVNASNPLFNHLMEEAGQRLNLRGHVCGGDQARTQRLHAAADVEGHLGHDGKFYLLDFSRTMPPMLPDPNFVNGHLYRLFRREFVVGYRKPLCSDAFSGFIRCDPEASSYNQDIREATEHLLNDIIPSFASKLTEDFTLLVDERTKVLNKNTIKINISERMHGAGINLRYLGQVYYHLLPKLEELSPSIQFEFNQYFLTEAVARVCKNDLSSRLRDKMFELRVPLEIPYRVLVVSFLNLIFGETPESIEYWDTKIKNDLFVHFSFHLLANKKLAFDFRRSTLFQQASSNTPPKRSWMLLDRICSLTGLKIRRDEKFLDLVLLQDKILDLTGIQNMKIYSFLEAAAGDIEKSKAAKFREDAPFDIADLIDLGLKVKFSNLVTSASGTQLQYQALLAAKEGSYEKAILLLERATERYFEALASDPLNPGSNFELAKTSHRLMDVRGKLQLRKAGATADTQRIFFPLGDPRTQDALKYYRRAIDGDKQSCRKLTAFAEFLSSCCLRSEAEKCYLQALELDPAYRPAGLQYANFLREQGEKETSTKIFTIFYPIQMTGNARTST